MVKLRAIKEEVVKVYREIADLFHDYNKNIGVKVREEHRVHVREHNKSVEEQGEADVNVNTEGEESEETATVETNTSASGTTSEESEETSTAEQPEENEESGVGGSASVETNITVGEQNTSVSGNFNVEVNA
jgi:hypothetical protein